MTATTQEVRSALAARAVAAFRWFSTARMLFLAVSVPVVLLAVAAYVLAARPWMRDWGTTARERQMALPGDAIVAAPTFDATNAITVDAPADRIWPWLAQIGQGRGGFYSHTWLENLFGSDIHNSDHILPEHQTPALGDTIWLARGLYGDSGPHLTVRLVEPGQALVLGSPLGEDTHTWAFVVQPVDADTSRLLVRTRTTMPYGVLQPIDSLMGRETLRGIAARAEGHDRRPRALELAADAGWLLGAVAVAVLLVQRRHGWRWLAPGMLAALPSLLSAGDMTGAFAGFLAVGIVTLGALIYGRRWWALFPTIATAVLVIVLLAPDLYATLGVVFLLLVAGLLVSRPRPRAGMVQRRGPAAHPV